MSMPRYPDPYRQSQGQKKRTPAPKKPASQPSRHTAHPQASRAKQSAPRPQPKMGGSSWRVMTNFGHLEKGMANYLSILALRTP